MTGIAYVCLYESYKNILSPYTRLQKGALLEAILDYAFDGIEPDFEGQEERFIWPSLRDQIDRDRLAYEAKCEKNRLNGSKGGKSRLRKPKPGDDCLKEDASPACSEEADAAPAPVSEAVATERLRTLPTASAVTPSEASVSKDKEKEKEKENDNDKEIDKDKDKEKEQAKSVSRLTDLQNAPKELSYYEELKAALQKSFPPEATYESGLSPEEEIYILKRKEKTGYITPMEKQRLLYLKLL